MATKKKDSLKKPPLAVGKCRVRMISSLGGYATIIDFIELDHYMQQSKDNKTQDEFKARLSQYKEVLSTCPMS